MKAAFAMRPGTQHRFFDDGLLRRLRRFVDLPAEPLTSFDAAADVEVLITAWGCPRLGPDELDNLPALKTIAHAAGSVKHFLSPDVLARGISVTSASHANARPVAEFTLAMIILTGKDVFRLGDRFRAERRPIDHVAEADGIGNYRRTVGIWGASAVGRILIDLLRQFDLPVLLCDPTLTAADTSSLGVELVSLDELFTRGDVVALTAPLVPATAGAIDARLLARMRDGSTLINTARGGLVDHSALTAELRLGRLNAVLDVTDPEPPTPDDDLWSLPNVILTPHLAGSQGNELLRLGESAVAEVEAFVAGDPPLHPVSLADWDTTA